MESGSVVLITGASTGFGKCTAERLAKAGYRVFGTSRNGAAPESLPRVSPAPGSFTMIRLDVQKDDDARACVQAVYDRAGRIDALLNNAGFSLCGAVEENTMEEVMSLFQTNYFGYLRMIRAVLPIMRRQRSGKIINVTSLAGMVGVPFHGQYSATKYALEGMSEALRMEVRRFGIHVSVIQPSDFKTEGTQARVFPSEPIEDYRVARTRAVDEMIRSETHAPGPEPFAVLVERILKTERPRLRYRVGADAAWVPAAKVILPTSAYEWAIRRNYKLDEPVQGG